MDAALGAPASSGYQPATATFLSGLVGLAYQQFENPSWNGQVPPDLLPDGYTQVAAFQVPEIDLSKAVDQFLAAHPELMPLVTTDVTAMDDALATQLNAQLSSALQDPALLAQISAGATNQWFGFALAPSSSNPTGPNIIALRGTRTAYEWALDATAVQVPVPFGWYSDGRFKLARVHLGFLILFAFMAGQVSTAMASFASGRGTEVAGHSLGSALSTLVSAFVKVKSLLSPVTMYTLATPRVGNDAFVSAFDYFVPSYRIVNLSDLVPELPPTSATIVVRGHTVSVQYGNVGEEWSYLWQTGDVGGNHAWVSNYDPAVQASVPTNQARTYPSSGIPC